MLRVGTNNPNHAFSFDYFAFFTNPFNTCPDFHLVKTPYTVLFIQNSFTENFDESILFLSPDYPASVQVIRG